MLNYLYGTKAPPKSVSVPASIPAPSQPVKTQLPSLNAIIPQSTAPSSQKGEQVNVDPYWLANVRKRAVKELQQFVEGRESTIVALRTELDQKNEENRRNLLDKVGTQEEVLKLKREAEALRGENKHLTSSLQDQKTSILRLNEELRLARGRIEEQAASVRISLEELRVLKEAKGVQEGDLAILRQALLESRKTLESQNANLQLEKEKLKKVQAQEEVWEKEKASLRAEHNKLENEINKSTKLEKLSRELHANKGVLEQEIHRWKEEAVQFQHAANKKKQDLEELNNVIGSLRREKEQLASDQQDKQAHHEATTKTLQGLKAEYKKLKEVATNLTSTTQSKVDEVKVLQESNTKLTQETASLHLFLAEAIKKVEEGNSEISAVKEKLRQQENRAEVAEKDILVLTAEKSAMERKATEQKVEVDSQARRILDLEIAQASGQEDINNFRAKLEAKQQECGRLLDEVKILRKRAESVAEGGEELKQELQELREVAEEYKAEVAKLQKGAESAKEREDDIAQLRKINVELIQEVEELEHKNVNLELVTSTKQGTISSMDQDIRKLEATKKEDFEVVNSLRRKCEEYESAIHQVTQSLEGVKQENKYIKDRWRRAVAGPVPKGKREAETKMTAGELVREIERICKDEIAQVSLLELEKQTLTKNLSDLEEEIKSLRKEEGIRKREIAKIRGDMAKLESDVFAALNSLNMSRDLISHLHSHVVASQRHAEIASRGFSGNNSSEDSSQPEAHSIPIFCRREEDITGIVEVLAVLNSKGELREPPISFYHENQENQSELAVLLICSSFDQAEEEIDSDWEVGIQQLGFKKILKIILSSEEMLARSGNEIVSRSISTSKVGSSAHGGSK